MSEIDQQLAELEALEAKATLGPWRPARDVAVNAERCVWGIEMVMEAAAKRDVVLISAARNNLAALIREVRLLRKALDISHTAFLAEMRGKVQIDGDPSGDHLLLRPDRKLGEL